MMACITIVPAFQSGISLNLDHVQLVHFTGAKIKTSSIRFLLSVISVFLVLHLVNSAVLGHHKASLVAAPDDAEQWVAVSAISHLRQRIFVTG